MWNVFLGWELLWHLELWPSDLQIDRGSPLPMRSLYIQHDQQRWKQRRRRCHSREIVKLIGKYVSREASQRAVSRYIRTATDILGPCGDNKNGCRDAFCSMNEKISYIKSYRSNRFNNYSHIIEPKVQLWLVILLELISHVILFVILISFLMSYSFIAFQYLWAVLLDCECPELYCHSQIRKLRISIRWRCRLPGCQLVSC